MTTPTFTTTGSTFNPTIALTGGSAATVTWSCAGFSDLTGINPTFSFGSAATRTVTMTVTGGGGYADVILVNLGFDSTQDQGLYFIGSSYNKSPQAVSAVANMNMLTGLQIFCAADTNLASSINFTGCSALQYIECFGAEVTGVTLTGCTSLIRLCLEANNTSALDLNPVKGCLYDLRAAAQAGGSLTFTPLTGPMAVEYHYCIRENAVTNIFTAAQLPVVQQYWCWNDHESGAFTLTSSSATQVLVEGNHYSSADLTNQFPPGNISLPTAPPLEVNLGYNALTSVILTGCSGLSSILLNNNLLGQSAVDGVLSTVAGWGTSNGTLDLTFNTWPSAAGLVSKNLLTGRGWTVHVDTTGTPDTSPYRLMDGLNNRPGVGSAGTQPPSSSSDNQPSGVTASLAFKVTESGLVLQGYWFWRADSTQSASASFALWQLTGTNTGTYLGSSTHASTSTMTAGQWNYVPLNNPYPLTANTAYAVLGSTVGTHPLTSGQFLNATTYNNGITNGPLVAYSDVLGSNPGPYGDQQGRVYTGGSDPTTNFPIDGFGGANFWVDVQVAFESGSPLLAAFP